MENTMLIVDDNILNRRILSLIFKETYDILEASSAEEALKMIENCNGNIDIMLLDLVMPGLGGFGVLKVRQRTEYMKSIPVVVITSSNAIEDQIKAFTLGANDFINKPFIPQIIISRVNNVIASTRRLSLVKHEAEKLRIKSEVDGMTGLFNKSTTEGMITEVLQTRPQYTHALLLVDIDDFKAVNDTYGHLVGDHTIKIVADCIAGLFRKTDIIGRVGGDEFVVMMTNVPSAAIVRSKVTELIEIMKCKPNLTVPANVSVSIGYTLSDGDTDEYSKLFDRADKALYEAKCLGKSKGIEYGTAEEPEIRDEREVVIVLSRNKNVCSMVTDCLPEQYRIVELSAPDEIHLVKSEISDKTALIYADLTDVDDISQYFAKVNGFEFTEKCPIIAVCEESNLSQFSGAIAGGVADIIPCPLEKSTFLRRSARFVAVNTEA